MLDRIVLVAELQRWRAGKIGSAMLTVYFGVAIGDLVDRCNADRECRDLQKIAEILDRGTLQ